MNQIFPKAAWSNLTPLLAAVLSLLLAGCGQPKSPPLRVGINAWPPYEFLFLAQEKGFFRDAGVDVKLVEFGSLSDARQAFENGKLDGWAATLVEVVMVHDGAMRKPRILRLLDFSDGADVIIAGKDTQSIRDLRGKRCGVEQASLGVFLLGRALESEGLHLTDVTLVSKDQATMGDELRSGGVQAVVTYPPESHRTLKDERFHVVFSSKSLPGEVVDVLAFDPEILRGRPGQIAAFQQALDRAFAFYQQQPEEACRIMGAREGLSGEEFQRQLTDGIRMVAPAEQAAYFQPGGTLRTALENVAHYLQDTRMISSRPEATDCLPQP